MARHWPEVRAKLLAVADLPAWVRTVIPGDSDAVAVGVTVEQESIDDSYMDFLRDQIRLAPRGPEWNEVLKKRERALTAHVGSDILLVTAKPNGLAGFVARLSKENLDVIHVEDLD